MADLTITAANVVRGSGAKILDRTAGVAITAGQTVFQAADGDMELADCDSATAAARVPDGIALNDAAANQPVQVLESGDITIGATLSPGVAYYQSATPGGIAPVADLTTGDYPCIIGIAKSASVLSVKIHPSGVAL